MREVNLGAPRALPVQNLLLSVFLVLVCNLTVTWLSKQVPIVGVLIGELGIGHFKLHY